MHERTHGARGSQRPTNAAAIVAAAMAMLALAGPAAPARAQEADSAAPDWRWRGPRDAGERPHGVRRWGPMLGLEDPSEMLEGLRKRLELREDQARDIRGLAEKFSREHADALDRARRMREEMRAAWELEGGRPGREDTEAIVEKYGRPLKELRPGLFQLRDEVLQRLTDEQRARLDALGRLWRERGRDCRPGDRRAPG